MHFSVGAKIKLVSDLERKLTLVENIARAERLSVPLHNSSPNTPDGFFKPIIIVFIEPKDGFPLIERFHRHP